MLLLTIGKSETITKKLVRCRSASGPPVSDPPGPVALGSDVPLRVRCLPSEPHTRVHPNEGAPSPLFGTKNDHYVSAINKATANGLKEMEYNDVSKIDVSSNSLVF